VARWLALCALAASACTIDARVGAFTRSGWVTVGWEAWQASTCPPARVDYGAMTHLAVRGWASQAGGGLGYGPDLTRSVALDLSARAHAAETRVLIGIGGYGDAGFASAAAAASRSAYVASLLAALDDVQYDGFELAIGYAAEDDVAALATALRAARPALVLAMPADWNGSAAPLAARLASTLDQVNLETMEMALVRSDWVSWHFAALAGEGPTHPASVAAVVARYTGAGVPREKLAVGVRFAGQAWSLPVTGPLQEIGAAAIVATPAYPEILRALYDAPGVVRGFSDDASGEGAGAEMSWLAFPSGYTPSGWPGAVSWVSYEDAASIAAKGAWARQNGLGGAYVWRIAEGVTNETTGANPLLDAVREAFLR
jgi:chitinase